ncbi:MAG: hypothetical protein HJJLKODD_01532 [Phycisphaerae bacterium]|nr:hypothetical protein [Phycisphaerae bacterium]
MTSLQRNIRQTQFRLGVNDWFYALGWSLLGAAGVWSVVVILDRLFQWQWPKILILAGLAAAVLAVSLIWAWVLRKNELQAAAALDAAAGLKERLSTGLFCQPLEDVFARAVVEDAESLSQRVSARSFIRFRWPSSLSFATVAMVLALIFSYLPISPLQSTVQANQNGDQKNAEIRKQEVQRIQRELQPLKELAEKNPSLSSLKEKLKSLDDLPMEKLQTPESVRKEAIKKVDDMADELRKQRDNANSEQLSELQRMFRNLKSTQQPQTPTEKLTQSLAKGDFKSAQDAIKEMQEELAKLEQKSDPQKAQQMEQQMKNLADQLKKAAEQQEKKDQLQQELKQAGVDEKTAQKATEQLTKQDMQKMADQMKKQGASDQQVKEMQKKLESMQQACKQCNSMGQQMQQAAQAMQQAQQGESSTGDASEQLQQASEMLNNMESMEQQISEMESTLADLQQMKDELANNDQNQNGDQGDESEDECPNCNGRGCSQCNGTGKKGQGQGQGQGEGKGGGMGSKGQGKGGVADEEAIDVRFKKERTKVNTLQGSIISKRFVDGEQVKGEVTSDEVQLITAAEQQATDAVNKAKVPNQYKRLVKDYFSQIRQEMNRKAPAEPAKSTEDKTSGTDQADGAKPADEEAADNTTE